MKITYILWSFLCLSGVTAAATEAITLQKQEMTTQKRTVLCNLIPDQCQNKPIWTLYRWAEQPQQYYLISNLKLYQLKQVKQSYQLLNQWDFSNYTPQKVSTHWMIEDIGSASDQKHLYPALFKISENSHAIALIQTFREIYSGGGMHEEIADFFEIVPHQRPKLIFQNIPFSAYRMIRACFSEEDYIKSGEGYCHDDENLILNIQYRKAYSWQMQYHYARNLSPVSDQKPLNQKKNYILQKGAQETIQFPRTWMEY